MSDKTDKTDSAADDQSGKADDDRWKIIRRERDDAKRQLRENEEKLRVATEQIEQHEATGKSDTEKLQRKIEKMERDYAAKIEDMSAVTVALTTERDTLSAEMEATKQATRMETLVDAVAAATGVGNRPRLRALLREAAVSRSVDIAPAKVDDKTTKVVVEVLRSIDGDTFAARVRGGTTGVAGNGTTQARIYTVDDMADPAMRREMAEAALRGRGAVRKE